MVTHRGVPDHEHAGQRRLWSPWQRCRVREVSGIPGKRSEHRGLRRLLVIGTHSALEHLIQTVLVIGPEPHEVLSTSFHSRVNQTLCRQEDDPVQPEDRDGWSSWPVKRPSRSTRGLVLKVQLAFRESFATQMVSNCWLALPVELPSHSTR